MPDGHERPRIAIDTNVLIAALTKSDGSAARVLDAWDRGRFDVVATEATLREAELVLNGRWLRRLAPAAAIHSLLQRLRERSVRVPERRIEGLPLRDPGDRRLVEAAVAGGAPYLVTADREMLRYRGHARTEFVTPGDLLKRLAPER